MKSEHCTKITKRTNKLFRLFCLLCIYEHNYKKIIYLREVICWEQVYFMTQNSNRHSSRTEEKWEYCRKTHISTLPISVFITSTVIADIWRHGDGVRQGMRWAVRWSNRRQTVKTDYLNPKEMPQSPCVFTSTASMPVQSGTTRVKLWWMLTMDTLVNNFTIYICFLSSK